MALSGEYIPGIHPVMKERPNFKMFVEAKTNEDPSVFESGVGVVGGGGQAALQKAKGANWANAFPCLFPCSLNPALHLSTPG